MRPRPIPEPEWRRQGELLFGKDQHRWRFRCPSCGHVQTYEAFSSLGIRHEEINQLLGFSCVGTVRALGRNTGFDKVVPVGQPDQGMGCTFMGAVDKDLMPVVVVRGVSVKDGKEIPVAFPCFEFALPCSPEKSASPSSPGPASEPTPTPAPASGPTQP